MHGVRLSVRALDIQEYIMKYTSKVVEIKFNLGHVAGSAANQLTNKIGRDYPEWEIVNIIANQVNAFRRLGFAVIAIVTLGFYAPSAGFAVILRRSVEK